MSTRLLKNEYLSLIFLLLILALVYFPFVDKAFHIDDTLFLKAAEQILVNPLDFYAGEVNWYGSPSTQFIINKNPPLVSYLIAAVASVFGFNEVALHSFFFIVLAFSIIGMFLLGRQFGCRPLMTTLLATFTPVFLVHGTNVMTDSTLLMFWIWGLVFWMNGIKTDSPKWFVFAGISIALGALTKYPGIFLLPLIMFSGAWKYRKHGWWLIAVLIPLVAMLSFEYYTRKVYGNGLFFEAFIYANENASKQVTSYFDTTLIGLAFLGGCFPVALFLGPLSVGRLFKIAILTFTIGILAVIFYNGGIGTHSFSADEGVNIGLVIQFCIFSLAGFCLLMVCLKELSNGFNHDSIFLLLWFFGIFVFATYLNWTINVRSFILATPAVGILMARRLEHWWDSGKNLKQVVSYSMIGLAGVIAVATMYADYVWANISRTAAKEITAKYNSPRRLFFQGHWGFQYYMEKAGALPVDYTSADIQTGEFVIVPRNNTAILRPNPVFQLVDVIEFSHNSIVATMSPTRSSGFYAGVIGAVPYSFEKPRKETYLVYRMK